MKLSTNLHFLATRLLEIDRPSERKAELTKIAEEANQKFLAWLDEQKPIKAVNPIEDSRGLGFDILFRDPWDGRVFMRDVGEAAYEFLRNRREGKYSIDEMTDRVRVVSDFDSEELENLESGFKKFILENFGRIRAESKVRLEDGGFSLWIKTNAINQENYKKIRPLVMDMMSKGDLGEDLKDFELGMGYGSSDKALFRFTNTDLHFKDKEQSKAAEVSYFEILQDLGFDIKLKSEQDKWSTKVLGELEGVPTIFQIKGKNIAIAIKTPESRPKLAVYLTKGIESIDRKPLFIDLMRELWPVFNRLTLAVPRDVIERGIPLQQDFSDFRLPDDHPEFDDEDVILEEDENQWLIGDLRDYTEKLGFKYRDDSRQLYLHGNYRGYEFMMGSTGCVLRGPELSLAFGISDDKMLNRKVIKMITNLINRF